MISIYRKLAMVVKYVLLRLGVRVVRASGDEWRYQVSSYDPECRIEPDEKAYLTTKNPKLVSLRSRYSSLNLPVCEHSVWSNAKLDKELNLPWFRGDNAYVWQFRQLKSEAKIRQYLMLTYVRKCDDLKLLDKLDEDGAFGCWTFSFGSAEKYSRDLLESVNEINFLDRELQISQKQGLRVLDIGAGYGRLAYRMCSALPNVEAYDCVDAVPESTFLCDFYLRYRQCDDRASALPLDSLGETLGKNGTYDLAVNIHSFSECTLHSVNWWLDKISELRIPYLLVVPNHPDELVTSELNGEKRDFGKEILKRGYKLVVKEAVYNDSELHELIGIKDNFHLYRFTT